jgi:hypothetical protein
VYFLILGSTVTFSAWAAAAVTTTSAAARIAFLNIEYFLLGYFVTECNGTIADLCYINVTGRKKVG